MRLVVTLAVVGAVLSLAAAADAAGARSRLGSERLPAGLLAPEALLFIELPPMAEASQLALLLRERPLLVRAISVAGLGKALTENEILDLRVALSLSSDGWVAEEESPGVQQVPLWAIAGHRLEGRALHGSAIVAILRAIERAYAERGLEGVRAEARPDVIRRLELPGSDGVLDIRVDERDPHPASQPR